MENIFQDIHNIPWSDLKHAYGNADDVPGLLMDLVHEDEDARQSAIYKLFGSVWHQGTIYEATSYVVPYLVKLLKSSQTPNRNSVAGLFAAIANGSGYLKVHTKPDSAFGENWQDIISDSDADLVKKLAEEDKWVAAVRRAVDPHLDMLYEFIEHEVWDIRFEVASALGKYPNHAKESLPILKAALEHEADEEIREAIEKSIQQLKATGE
jgi:HEAT repeat protein